MTEHCRYGAPCERHRAEAVAAADAAERERESAGLGRDLDTEQLHPGFEGRSDLDPFEPITDTGLDPGIKRYVMALRAGGIETFESCEGGEGHPFPEPTIRFHGGAAEGFRAFAVAVERGLPVFKVRLSYTVEDGFMTGPWWEMVFTTKDRCG
jgi:hypothetical protein